MGYEPSIQKYPMQTVSRRIVRALEFQDWDRVRYTSIDGKEVREGTIIRLLGNDKLRILHEGEFEDIHTWQVVRKI
jgi:hypothetical protein